MRAKEFWNFVAAEAGDSSPEFGVTVYIGARVISGMVRVRGYGPQGANEFYRSCWLTVSGHDVLIDISAIDLIHKGEAIKISI